ncbi:MAG: nitroreductase family protein, partial [Mucinivorans sp.]
MISAIKEHRSVRDFQTKPISDSVMEQILTAATRASTVGGMQLYSIVVTTDPA